MKVELVVSFTVDGYHSWPDAPDIFKEFRERHRHLFKFICFYPVEQGGVDTRQEELFELRQKTIAIANSIGVLCDNLVIDYQNYSCEGIAQLIIAYGYSKVFVGEDDGFGALVTQEEGLDVRLVR
jgi:hypothetical protein